MRHRLLPVSWLGVALIFTVLVSTTCHARELLFDGNFESGTLQGWKPGTTGTAIVTRRGSCFSDHDTRALSIRGDYAGLLRSPDFVTQGNGAMLTSKPFTAGRGILFVALSELNQPLSPGLFPLALEVGILDPDGQILEQRVLATAVVELPAGCPSHLADTSFSQHYIGTQAYQGKTIKLRFTQHEETARYGGFTLIDQVELINPGVSHTQNSALASAGLAIDEQTGERYLIAEQSSTVSSESNKVKYSWLINGETSLRPYFNPCISDLLPGHYAATLYLSKEETLLGTDSLFFSVSGNVKQASSLDSASETLTSVCNKSQPPLSGQPASSQASTAH